MPKLIHSECGGSIITDNSRPPLIADKEVWYQCKCAGCGAHLGILANVENEREGCSLDQLRREDAHKSNRPA